MTERTPPAPERPLFPRWLDNAAKAGGLLALAGMLVLVALLYYGIHPQAMDVGYQPEQPVPYSHRLHAGELGIDCRYCHGTVETSAFASVPPTETCMNCHATIRPTSEKLLTVRESHATGLPVPWVRVHDNPDFVYFDHSAHVTRGVGCVECHGRVDRMEEVFQAKALSMAWCLDCHRAPDERLRPPAEATNMTWTAPRDPAEYGAELREARAIDPPTDCSTCHR